MALLGILVLGFFLFEAAIYGSHRLMHCRWSGPFWHSHNKHHQLYNPKHPAGVTYRQNDWRSFMARSALYLFFVGLIFVIFPLGFAIVLAVEVSVLAFVTDFIHDSTHLEYHWLERFGWYRRLKHEHWIHHANVKKNLGILSFFFDRLTGSYKR